MILRVMHLQDSCVLRRCAVTYRGVALRTGDLEDIESGFGLVVHVPPALANDILPTNVNHLQLWAPAMAAAMDAHEPEVEDDNIAFLQQTPKSPTAQSRGPSPLTCKPGDVDDGRELPMTFPGSDLPRRRLPWHDGGEDWIPVLVNSSRCKGSVMFGMTNLPCQLPHGLFITIHVPHVGDHGMCNYMVILLHGLMI